MRGGNVVDFKGRFAMYVYSERVKYNVFTSNELFESMVLNFHLMYLMFGENSAISSSLVRIRIGALSRVECFPDRD